MVYASIFFSRRWRGISLLALFSIATLHKAFAMEPENLKDSQDTTRPQTTHLWAFAKQHIDTIDHLNSDVLKNTTQELRTLTINLHEEHSPLYKEAYYFYNSFAFVNAMRSKEDPNRFQKRLEDLEEKKKNPDVQYTLANFYLTYGTTNHVRKALTLLRKAAQNGHTKSQTQLGELYLNGGDGRYLSLPRHVIAGTGWLEMAAKKNHGEAQYLLANFCLSKRNNSRAHKRGIDLLTCAAANGHSEAQYRLGHLYLESPTKRDAGIRWLTRAGESGHAPALYDLECFYKTEGRVNEKRDQLI